ncbi:YHS domain-containing (seleno)protein [Emticicia sp. SJ17W-69]|uniref:YHS domain-containing (seleno)protein n=1 Tax=Emticicia sp. SJ17W-69 TaxID=3421657 RepID=UPI003EBE1414
MKKKLVLVFSFCLFILSSFAQKTEVFSNDEGAIKGYDAVAYFKVGKATKGNSSFAYQWKDAKWLFESQENLDAFKAMPEKYAPQYGGYCAFGLSENHKSPTTPEAFTIVNDKLYLNYNAKVKELWLKDKESRIIKADSNWVQIK